MMAALFVFLAACAPKTGDDGTGDDGTGGNQTDDGTEYTLAKEDGCNLLTIYYHNDGGYADKDVWLWYGAVAGRGYEFHPCAYGAKAMFNIPESVDEVGYLIRTKSVPGSTS